MSKEIQLSDHFTYSRLLRFTLPSIASMIFTSIYGIFDGYFISNYVGKIPFTGLNLIMPFIMMLGAVGNMIGIGGSALIGKTLGEGDQEKANGLFSFFTYFMVLAGIILACVGNLFLPQTAALLGAKEGVLASAIDYGRICMIGLIFLTLQYSFQGFLITAEKPQLGFYITVAAGIANILLDALFIIVFKWGIKGAALATSLSQGIGAIVPTVLFLSRKNNWILKLGLPRIDWRALLQACSNGASEFLSSISMSVVGMLYNTQLLRYAGNDGVAAYGVIMYVTMIFIAVFIGLTMGTAPLFSFQYGAANYDELKNLFRKIGTIRLIVSVAMLGAAEALARPLALIFTSYDQGLMNMTIHAFRIYSISFLFCGVGIFGSSLFTALNNGLISAILSFFRTVVLQLIFVFLLPLIWGLDGIWWSIALSEGFAALLAVWFMIRGRERYQYF